MKFISEVKKENGCLVLDGHYAIELSRVDSYAKIVSWISHLTEKNWVTGTMIHEFVRKACAHHKLDAWTDC